jgi:hypothetical protein
LIRQPQPQQQQQQQSSHERDPYVHAIELAQCLAYIVYQALENVAHLTDLGVVPASLVTSRYNPFRDPRDATASASTRRLWLVSSRFWLAGVSCDVLRLAREAYVAARRRRTRQLAPSAEGDAGGEVATAAEAKATDRRWWSELFVAGCWLPMSAHYSIDGGLFKPGVEDGVLGALGLAASWEGWRRAWAETKE